MLGNTPKIPCFHRRKRFGSWRTGDKTPSAAMVDSLSILLFQERELQSGLVLENVESFSYSSSYTYEKDQGSRALAESCSWFSDVETLSSTSAGLQKKPFPQSLSCHHSLTINVFWKPRNLLRPMLRLLLSRCFQKGSANRSRRILLWNVWAIAETWSSRSLRKKCNVQVLLRQLRR